jgi:glycosyltransferase involved in cell wall biosynthesis
VEPPTISVIVPVHNSNRPIFRAVNSIVSDLTAEFLNEIEVIVVCHEVSPEVIGEKLGHLRQNSSVKLLTYKDGVRSPAGPINHGIRNASGQWILILGSDDSLEPNFATEYLTTLSKNRGLDVILLPIKLSNGSKYYPSPVPQLGLRKNLITIRDRLFYRTAPTALVRRGLLQSNETELYTEGISNGEDLIHSTWLWTHAERIHMDRKLPHYIIGEDATDRVTSLDYSVEELREPLEILTSRLWFLSLAPRIRNSFGIKYLRSNILSKPWNNLDPESKRGLISEFKLLDEHCKIDRGSLSIMERINLNRLLSNVTEINPVFFWERSRVLVRLASILPTSIARIFSPDAWPLISTDIYLGNIFWFRKFKRKRNRATTT